MTDQSGEAASDRATTDREATDGATTDGATTDGETTDSTRGSSLGRLRLGLWIGSLVVLVGSAVVIVVVLTGRGGSSDPPEPVLRGALVFAEPFKAPDQTGPDTTGATVPLVAAPAKGTVNILYFGYTNCPDICPIEMNALAAGLREMTPEQRDRIRVVFTTVDPDRDDASVLEPWLAKKDPSFIGVIPPLDETDETLTEMGFAPTQTEPMPDGNGYAVSHPAGMFVYTDDGLAHVMFHAQSAPEDIAHDLGRLLGGWDSSYAT